MEHQLTCIYSYQSLVHAVNIYNFPYDYTERLYLYGLRFLFQYRHNDNRLCPTIHMLTNTTVSLFNVLKNTKLKRTYVLEIIDILLEFDPLCGKQCVEELKQIEENERILKQVQNEQLQNRDFFSTHQTIYKDSQNVHTTKINESVKKIAILLVSKYKCRMSIYQIETTLLYLFKDSRHIQNVIQRICRDVSTFGINISLYQVFTSLWQWIQEHEHKQELLLILVAEMKEMDGYCATGYLSRLINVTQGFSDIFHVSISTDEQCNAVVRQFLNKQLQECTNTDVIDGILTKSEEFRSFIYSIIENQRNSWLQEYGDSFCILIDDIVHKYITL